MRKDTEEALQRLERELLAEEAEDIAPAEVEETEDPEFEEIDYGEFSDEPDKEETLVYRNFSNDYGKNLRNFATGYKAYNSDTLDTDLEEFSRRVEQGKKSPGVLLPLITALLAGLAVLYIAWLLFGGML